VNDLAKGSTSRRKRAGRSEESDSSSESSFESEMLPESIEDSPLEPIAVLDRERCFRDSVEER
jgi:hypothetical protein